ncbi:hypothetical protein TanjilG_20551 [Lupinus angustifolius]|uniref:Uncharacterized protein n=1 Tax=Lupinus angustifolius TaxID=3871 RepID=A0A1J7FNJ5_LUPAN|nr:hypothetical protein TanjilG_20551 [Lupinus angustifolius]
MDKRLVDVEAILSDEMYQFVVSEFSKDEGYQTPRLIMGIRKKVGVDISIPSQKGLKLPIDKNYIQKFCNGKKVENVGLSQMLSTHQSYSIA